MLDEEAQKWMEIFEVYNPFERTEFETETIAQALAAQEFYVEDFLEKQAYMDTRFAAVEKHGISRRPAIHVFPLEEGEFRFEWAV